MATPHLKSPGARSTISPARWELALYEYHVLDKSARTIGAELERDHSTVIRKFQGMLKREPEILARLAAVYAKPKRRTA